MGNLWFVPALVGGGLVAVVLVDAVSTTVNVSERSGRLTALVLRVTRPVFRAIWRGPRRSSVALAQVLALLSIWIGGLWIGWWLLLLADPLRFVDVATGNAIGMTETFHLAGSAVFALGLGDVVPASTAARLVLPLGSATGLALVTLAITYLLTLTRVAVHKRQVAWMISGLGADTTSIVARCWDGESFRSAARVLDQLATELALLAENQLSIPVLYEVGSRDRDRALAPGLVRVLDAVELMDSVAEPAVPLPHLTSHRLRQGIEEILRSAPSLRPEVPRPSPPSDDVLRDLGMTPVSNRDRSRYQHLRDRLHALSEEEGWPLHDFPDTPEGEVTDGSGGS